MHNCRFAGMKDPLLLDVTEIPRTQPVLIAGPTASGKSSLALRIAEAGGGIVVNADASQVFNCWQLITARPDASELARAPHVLYGHLPYDALYSTGHWLREVAQILEAARSGGPRPIIVGGTGLNFRALLNGLADIPATPEAIRQVGNDMTLTQLLEAIDPETRDRIDPANRARVQRAWEVYTNTGKGLAHWQDDTPPPLLQQQDAVCLALHSPAEWIDPRIATRFDAMIAGGALDEVHAMQERYDPELPSCRAIGVPELMGHIRDGVPLAEARAAAVLATRRYAKRQRTWIRSKMQDWVLVPPPTT